MAARFRVDPGYVCRRARDLVLEGEATRAVHLLGEAFEGLDLNASFAILKGEKTLVDGEGGADLVSDESPESAAYRAEVAGNFGHRVRIGGRWHEPYALVDDLGESDLNNFWRVRPGAQERAYHAWRGTARGPNLIQGMTRQAVEEACRPLHYADDPDKDLLVYLEGGFYHDGRARPYADSYRRPKPTLFRTCEAPPPWMAGARTPQEALDAGLRDGHVDVRGHRAWYGPPGPLADHPDPSRREEAVPRTLRWLEERAAASRDMPEESLAARAARPVLVEPRSPEADGHFESLVPGIREAVLAQAGRSGGFVEVDLGGGPVQVPRAPLERWALARLKALHLAPDWTPVSPPDLKLPGDDRDHSDWLIGAGIDPFSWHGPGEDRRRLREAGYDAMYRIQDERLNKVHHAVLCGEGSVAGPVWIARRGEMPPLGAVVVLPNASPSWLPAVQAAIGATPGIGGVIVEEGGAMAHLVTVLREGGAPVIRWPGARAALADTAEVRLDCADGSVEILAYRLDGPDADEDGPPVPGMP